MLTKCAKAIDNGCSIAPSHPYFLHNHTHTCDTAAYLVFLLDDRNRGANTVPPFLNNIAIPPLLHHAGDVGLVALHPAAHLCWQLLLRGVGGGLRREG